MLSRRHLRIKVFQALYALESARDADYRLAEDFITESFKPDLNSMIPQEPQKLEGLRKIASLMLTEAYNNYQSQVNDDEDSPSESVIAARNAFSSYQKQFKEDTQRISRALAPEVESIGDRYYFLLQWLLELGNIAQNDRERVYEDADFPIAREAALDTNVVMKALRESKVLSNEVIRRGIAFDSEQRDFLRRIYREVFKTNEKYQAYCAVKKHTTEEDSELMQFVLRDVLYKNEEMVNYFEQNDLYWAENGDLLRKMVSKTLKSATTIEGVKLVPLTDEWDEDKYFMEELFKQTVDKWAEFEVLISEPLKNWDLERLAITDVIILKMGLAEMMTFPAIPTKVTVNECIELAKDYSTLKSGKFINGVLDTVSKQLISENKIRKSGRGLLDNK
jgi:transcription antitermination protein NusB